MLVKILNNIASAVWGWKTDRKLLIFESDDWGALYLPKLEMIKNLEREGLLKNGRQGHERYDCLENSADLKTLFDLLSSFSDMNGNPAKFTFNTVMANPDFEKIKESGFQEYFHMPIFDSYRHFNGDDVQDLWHLGMNSKLMKPQFHAREHVNVPRWMNDLRENRRDTRIAFCNQYYCQKRSENSPKNYLTAYWPDSPESLSVIEQHTKIGLEEFKKEFKFPSESFVACCFVLPAEIEECTSRNGVRLIQTQERYRAPKIANQSSSNQSRYTGQRNRFGQYYSVRSVLFEPAVDHSIDWADSAFHQVVSAFNRRIPAVVSTHRVNYVGGRDLQNREDSICQLHKFLTRVTNAYPEVEFLSSDELLHLMSVKSTNADE